VATKYVSSAADGTRDGTQAANGGAGVGPWTLAQAIAATPAAGDEIRIMADGTYSRSATWTCAYANGTAAANIIITGANSSGTVDGTRPTIQASAGSITLLNITGSHIHAKRLIVDGNSQTSLTGLTVGANYSRATLCHALGCSVKGLNLAASLNSAALIRCSATTCSGTCGIFVGSGGRAMFCEAYANTTHGFQADLPGMLIYCIASANSGASSDGFNSSSVGYSADHCVSYGNGRAGFDVSGNNSFGTYLSNCLAYGNTGEGFTTDGVKSGAFLLNCAGGSNTAGNYNATNLTANSVENFVTLTGDPFTSAATGDFSINNTASAGAALRAAGFPGAMPRGTSTGYTDIGAVQHADAGGGGTTYVSIIGS
jgi:hypothetical protein